jgi:hypothetical protein
MQHIRAAYQEIDLAMEVAMQRRQERREGPIPERRW